MNSAGEAHQAGPGPLESPAPGADVVGVAPAGEGRAVDEEYFLAAARADHVANVSHELRTSMTSVLGFLGLALEREIDEETRSVVSVASANAERVLALIDDLLEITKGRNPLHQLTLEHWNMADLVHLSAQAMAPMAASRGITFELAGDASVFAYVDGFRIRQVIDNLLSNALKYSDRYGTVRVSVEGDGDSAVVVVRDQSTGLRDDEIDRLFDRFFRGEEALKAGIPGTGLGLSISRDIVERHGGTLTASTLKGHGVVFTLALPRSNSSGVSEAAAS